MQQNDIYKEWAKKTSMYWLKSVVLDILSNELPATPQYLTDRITDVVYKLWWGEEIVNDKV